MTSSITSFLRSVGILAVIWTGAWIGMQQSHAWAQSQATLMLRGVVPARLSADIEPINSVSERAVSSGFAGYRILVTSNSPMIVTVETDPVRRGRSPTSAKAPTRKLARVLHAHESFEIPRMPAGSAYRHRISMAAP